MLVVDDDVRNLFALTTVFERYNINVITAESGKEAINVINDESPKIDMVLMDIMMPEMDGYETTQKIRREHKNSTLPIIAVTAKAMKGDRQKCIEAGASDYITKPLKIDQICCQLMQTSGFYSEWWMGIFLRCHIERSAAHENRY